MRMTCIEMPGQASASIPLLPCLLLCVVPDIDVLAGDDVLDTRRDADRAAGSSYSDNDGQAGVFMETPRGSETARLAFNRIRMPCCF